MENNENLMDIEKLSYRPFTKFCMSIGAVPTSYLASMTIAEQMLWLSSYIENQIVPTVNNNAEAVEELQNLYEELHSYVEHYFDNLDVQEEINKKLDKMAVDGTLANILNNLLNDFRDEVNLELEGQNLAISTLREQVSDIGSGSPLVAASTAGMTDTTRVYVNTTDGHWYYYANDQWNDGGAYQAAEDSDEVDQLRADLVGMSELKENLFDVDDVQIGKNWTGGTAADRAVCYIPVKSSTLYSFESNTAVFNGIVCIEKAANTGASPSLASTTIGAVNPHKEITTTASTKYLCIQFQKATDISEVDFTNLDFYVYEGSTKYLAVDTNARKEIKDIEVKAFNTLKELATSQKTGLNRVGGYLLRNIVEHPYASTLTQDAHSDPYYDVNYTVGKYDVVNEQNKIPQKNIMNSCASQEIDFSPEDGYVRIVVGKNSDDVFFVAHVASNRLGEFGDPSNDRLETTTDFVHFTTILRSSTSSSEDGIAITNITNIKVKSVKEFSDGHYIVALNGLDTTDNTNYTRFYRMNADFSEISIMRYVNFNSQTVDMVDENAGEVYDWSIFVDGNKALVTTYGNRNPATDYGRVWYTENSGYGWKQIFQTSTHLPAQTQAHTHGVMIDPYTNRLYVIVGENYASIWYSDKGYNTTNSDWTKIDISAMPVYDFQTGIQVVNGYPFNEGLVFGSDNEGVGCVYRINKLDNGSLSYPESAHEFLPNKFNGTFYCAAEMSKRDDKSPLLICETHENCMLTEANNELLNYYHKARVLATYDGINFTEVWSDDTYGTYDVYINEQIVERDFSLCTRGMNCYLLKNGDAVIKYAGRDYYYFGGDPMFSVTGLSNGCSKVKIIKNVGKYL